MKCRRTVCTNKSADPYEGGWVHIEFEEAIGLRTGWWCPSCYEGLKQRITEYCPPPAIEPLSPSLREFFLRLISTMDVYAVEAHGYPVALINVSRKGPPPDEVLTDHEMVQRFREARRERARTADALGMDRAEVDKGVDRMEVRQAVEGDLGAALRRLKGADGLPLWDGDLSEIHIRPATGGERVSWREWVAAKAAGETVPNPMDGWLFALLSSDEDAEVEALMR